MAALCRGVFWQRRQGSPVSSPEARGQVPTGSPFSPPLAAVQSREEAGACVPARLERCARANPLAWRASRSLWTGWGAAAVHFKWGKGGILILGRTHGTEVNFKGPK